MTRSYAWEELTEIQQQLISAWAAADPSVHQRVLADNWSVIDPMGIVMTKSDVLATAFSAAREIEIAEVDEIKVRDLDGFAIVTGRTRVIGVIGGQEVNITLRFTDVSDRRSGAWKCLASQGTFVAAPESE